MLSIITMVMRIILCCNELKIDAAFVNMCISINIMYHSFHIETFVSLHVF